MTFRPNIHATAASGPHQLQMVGRLLVLCVLVMWSVSPSLAGEGFRALPELTRAESWQTLQDGVAIATQPSGILTFTIDNLQNNDTRVVKLIRPIPLSGADAFNYWVWFPATTDEYGLLFTPLYVDSNGKEIGKDQERFISTHISPPNSRKAGLWFYDTWQTDPKATAFIGFSIQVTDAGGSRRPHTIYLRNFGLENTNYRTVPLYYMVGNFRDNFSDPSFNGVHARALTNEDTGDDTPFVQLDNLIDVAKQGRPARVNLHYFVYDIQDRLVYENKLKGVPTETPADFSTKIPVSITSPGTYRIEGKSYNAESGDYFTTDWVKLIVIKGKSRILTPIRSSRLLSINPGKPFGRFEKTDKQEITFQVGSVSTEAGPVELRYTVMPYSTWVPRQSAVRPVTFDHILPVKGPGALNVPYNRKCTVELIVAELWQGNHCLDREERPIGVANTIDKTPAFTNRAELPSLGDLAGPGKVWTNSTLVTRPGDDAYDDLERNIDEAKKLTPNIGFSFDITRIEPIPGVFDWDYLTRFFDLAAKKGCRLLPYMNMKWPMDWAPVEFQIDDTGCAHRLGDMYGYMAGKYLYFNGEKSPGIRRDFITQFARRYLNHQGLLGYYFENEHAHTEWLPWSVSRSYHEAYRKQFASYVAARYPTIGKLNALYGTNYPTFAQVQLPSAVDHSCKLALADYLLFRRQVTENAALRDQVGAARAIDPQRPIIVYGLTGVESDATLRSLVAKGCMMANGGVHSDFTFDSQYERDNSIPGLMYRMEPHDVSNYDPRQNGFDEMIFGMLGMGGRGLNFHIFLPGHESFSYRQAMQPGQKTGYDKVVSYLPEMRELSAAEKQHDTIGIMELHANMFGGPYEESIWGLHWALYVNLHYCPRVAAAEVDPNYLKGSKIIFVGGTTAASRQIEFLKAYLNAGGQLVVAESANKYRLENPDAPKLTLLAELGIDPGKHGEQEPGLSVAHDVYRVGMGKVLLLRGPQPRRESWPDIIRPVLKWTNVTERLADSDDPDMQIHVLKNADTFYLATTHRSEFGGPRDWSGQLRFTAALTAKRYRVTEMMSRSELGTFTPSELAAGFDAGAYSDLKMKVFRISPAR
jgi:hypothetical protein